MFDTRRFIFSKLVFIVFVFLSFSTEAIEDSSPAQDGAKIMFLQKTQLAIFRFYINLPRLVYELEESGQVFSEPVLQGFEDLVRYEAQVNEYFGQSFDGPFQAQVDGFKLEWQEIRDLYSVLLDLTEQDGYINTGVQFQIFTAVFQLYSKMRAPIRDLIKQSPSLQEDFDLRMREQGIRLVMLNIFYMIDTPQWDPADLKFGVNLNTSYANLFINFEQELEKLNSEFPSESLNSATLFWKMIRATLKERGTEWNYRGPYPLLVNRYLDSMSTRFTALVDNSEPTFKLAN